VQNSDELPSVSADYRQLDLIGGEPLDCSGFEAEQTDPEFAANEIPKLSAGEVVDDHGDSYTTNSR
jgi:hypothetical protein